MRKLFTARVKRQLCIVDYVIESRELRSLNNYLIPFYFSPFMSAILRNCTDMRLGTAIQNNGNFFLI